jgi:hypothetical protein
MCPTFTDQYLISVLMPAGANDICPALSLGPNDVVLARAGEALAMYAAAAAQDSSVQQLAAPVYVWNTHEELAQLVREHAQAASG